MRSPTLLTVLPLLPIGGVNAWDPLGHQTVGFLAAKYFTPNTTARLTSLIGLSDDPKNHPFDMGDAAAWADTVRSSDSLPWSRQWHFVNPRADNPATGTCDLRYPADCAVHGAAGNCIIDAILNQTRVVMDLQAAPVARRNATMWVLHFFGDLHQPMHAWGWKAGGNLVRPVCFGGGGGGNDTKGGWCDGNGDGGGDNKVRSLHSVWDSSIPRKLRGLRERESAQVDKAAARSWAEEIFERQMMVGVGLDDNDDDEECGGMGCVVDWARESNRLVCEHAVAKGEDWILSHDLSGEYFLENAKVVERQIGKAGRRLGHWMNAVADLLDQISPPEPEYVEGAHVGGDL